MIQNQIVTVFGAYGHTGRFVVSELRKRGFTPILSGRDAAKLKEAGNAHGGLEGRVTSVDDPASLDRALSGAVAVINCAGPFIDTAVPVIDAALRASIHYLDVAAEQAAVLAVFERFASAARDAGVVVIPAMAFYGGPERVRSLTLTDCDTHDNWPPEAFKPFLAMAAAGGLRGTLETMLSDKSVYRSLHALGPAYEHPDQLTDNSIEKYLRPFVRTEQRTHDLQRFLAAFDNKHTLAIEAQLKTLKAPTLIVWGTDDVYFDVKWSHWLVDNIPGTRRRVELQGARIFFPEERWQEFNKELRAHWQVAQKTASQVAP
jgi:pimeloyl-ACP methyl ester carboxylesterase